MIRTKESEQPGTRFEKLGEYLYGPDGFYWQLQSALLARGVADGASLKIEDEDEDGAISIVARGIGDSIGGVSVSTGQNLEAIRNGAWKKRLLVPGPDAGTDELVLELDARIQRASLGSVSLVHGQVICVPDGGIDDSKVDSYQAACEEVLEFLESNEGNDND